MSAMREAVKKTAKGGTKIVRTEPGYDVTSLRPWRFYMRFARMAAAAALISASPDAMACELHDGGGHRYFAFSDVHDGALPEQSDPASRQIFSPPATKMALRSQSQDRWLGDQESTEPIENQPTDAVSRPRTSFADQPTVTDARPDDGTVLR